MAFNMAEKTIFLIRSALNTLGNTYWTAVRGDKLNTQIIRLLLFF